VRGGGEGRENRYDWLKPWASIIDMCTGGHVPLHFELEGTTYGLSPALSLLLVAK